MSAPTADVTGLLLQWGQGDQDALGRLIPLVQQELHRIARRCMAGERVGKSLQATALVNEAYLRLVDGRAVAWHDRAHFLAVSARVMRRILTRVNGDDAYVLLNTGSSTQPFLYGVSCHRENGRWLERDGANGPGWERTVTIPTLGLCPSGTMPRLTQIWSESNSTAASSKSLSSIVPFWWSGGACRRRRIGLERGLPN
jgi:hypothetical protein